MNRVVRCVDAFYNTTHLQLYITYRSLFTNLKCSHLYHYYESNYGLKTCRENNI